MATINMLNRSSRAAFAAAARPRAGGRINLVVAAAASGRYDDFTDGGRSGGARREYSDNNNRSGGGGGGRRDYDRNGPSQRRGGYGNGGGGGGGGRSYDNGGGGGGQQQQYRQRRDGNGNGEGGSGNNYRPRGPRGGLPGGDGRPPRTLSPEAVALNASISGAGSWRALQAVLEGAPNSGAGLDAFQLVAMLARAASLPRPGPEAAPDDAADFQGFVASVYGCLLASAATARPQQTARGLAAIASLGLYNAELVDALVARAERELHNTYDGDLVTLLGALAALGHAPSPTFAEQLLRRTQPRLATMQPEAMAGLIGALSRLGIALPPEWLATYVDQGLLPRTRDFGANDFSAALVSLASLGWRPAGPAQLSPLVDRCFTLLQFELRVARPDGSLGGSRPPSAQASMDDDRAGRGGGGGGQRYDGRRGGGAGGRGGPPTSVPPEVAVTWLVNVAWAFAQMLSGTGAQLPPQWGAAMFDKLQYARRAMRPAELASFVSSCACVGARPSDATLEALLRDLANMYSDASGDDLANFAMALAQWGYTPSDRLLDDFLITLRRKLPATSAAGLATVVSALPSLSSGVRLNEIVAEARARYEALAAAAAAAYGDAAQTAAAQEEPAAAAA